MSGTRQRCVYILPLFPGQIQDMSSDSLLACNIAQIHKQLGIILVVKSVLLTELEIRVKLSK